MEKLLITNMSINDIDDIMEIETASFKIPWSKNAFISELTTNQFAIYLVAKVEGKVVGYVGMWQILDEGHITNIAVRPDYRGRRIGEGLVETLVDVAKGKNIEKLTLEVRESNDIAQRLYIKFGFEVSGVRKKYYSDNQEDALIMWKAV